MQQIEITVARRIRTGKSVARRLRAKGKVPAIVYGLEKQAVPVEVDDKTMRLARSGESGENAIFLLKMAGTDVTRHAIMKEVQADPVTGRLLHIDFLRIDLSKVIDVAVPVHATGTAPGIKEGGLLEFVHREVRVQCLPGDIPGSVDVGVGHLHIGDAVRACDVRLPASVKLLSDADMVIAVVHAPKAEEVAAPVAEAEAAEPEVIAKGKEAKEGAEKAEAKPGEAPAKGEKTARGEGEKAEKAEKAPEKKERDKGRK